MFIFGKKGLSMFLEWLLSREKKTLEEDLGTFQRYGSLMPKHSKIARALITGIFSSSPYIVETPTTHPRQKKDTPTNLKSLKHQEREKNIP